MESLVDPAVSRSKFEREVQQHRELKKHHNGRGCWMVDAEYPEAFFIFASGKVRPASLIFGAVLDFTNYDLWPPSVRLVNPFSREPYRMRELPSPLPRRLHVSAVEGGSQLGSGPQQGFTSLMQAYGPEEIPFLCVPGVREYHAHASHTGDSWLAHRALGRGTLHCLVDLLYRYGVAPITGLNVRVDITGFTLGEVPA